MPRDRGAGDLLDRVRAEIDARLDELRPHVEEQQRLLAAAESLTVGGDAPVRAKPARRVASAKPKAAKPSKARQVGARAKKSMRGPRGATQQAIEAALEHGSHTLAELVLVTAIPAAPIRSQLGRLQKGGVVSRVSREGKTAYSLLSAAAVASSGPRKGARAK